MKQKQTDNKVKSLFLGIFISLTLISFNKNGFKNDNSVVFSSEKLNRHYKMDSSPFGDQQLEKS